MESPATPKKRYSCISEYGTPKGSDDSDNSMYYSFVLSDEDNAVNKENSINGGMWAVSDSSNSPMAARVSKAKTPLLRKVLQTNCTPRNKNNKRVSFSNVSKPSPTPKAAIKIVKANELEINSLNSGSDRGVAFDLKPIEESLPKVVPVEQQKPDEKSDATADCITISDSSSDVTDDLENELHNTIIENPPSTTNVTLVTSGEELSAPTPVVTQTLVEKLLEVQPVPPNESSQLDPVPKNVTPPQPNVSTVPNTRTVEEILRDAAKNVPQTRNTAKINRQRLANDSRKSILPIAKNSTRATTYKRRSSTYEPRKMVDPRKSLGVLKQVASKVTKSIGGEFFEF